MRGSQVTGPQGAPQRRKPRAGLPESSHWAARRGPWLNAVQHAWLPNGMINPSGQLGTAGRTHVACGFSWCRATAGVGGSTGAAWPLRAGDMTPALVQLLLCGFTTNPTKFPPARDTTFSKGTTSLPLFHLQFCAKKWRGGLGGLVFPCPTLPKKKKVCCHLTRRWGRRTLKRSHLLPQIIPPARRALEFQISGPQVRRPWKWGRVGFTVPVREQGRVWPFWAGSAGSAPSWATGPAPRSQKVFLQCTFSENYVYLCKAKQTRCTWLQEACRPSPACQRSHHRCIY